MKKLLLVALSAMLLSSAANAQTYSSTSAMPSPSAAGCPGINAPGVSSITVPLTGTVSTPSDITVNLNLNGSCLAGTLVALFAPSGDSCILINRTGRSGSCFASTCLATTSANTLSFNSTFTTPISLATSAVPTGNYTPTGSVFYPTVGNLNTFLLGQSANGVWQVKIYNDGGVTGALPAWSITFGPSALPLNLISFNGKSFSGYNLIEWITGSEKNTSMFELQRSNDGKEYAKVASIAAVGEGDNEYNQKDNNASGTLYYRLKMIDKDGQYTYSNNLKIVGKQNNEGLVTISPNPAKTNVNLTLTNQELLGTESSIVNITGQTVHSFIIKESKMELNVAQYPAGIYIVKFSDGSLLRFTKQD